MFFASVSNRSFVVIFWVLAFLFGFMFMIPSSPHKSNTGGVVFGIVYMLLVLGSLILCKMRCDTPVLSYFQGQCVVSVAYMTGCANISLPIIMVVLSIHHTIMTVVALLSFAIGKREAQRQFLRITSSFSRGRFAADDAIAAAGLADE